MQFNGFLSSNNLCTYATSSNSIFLLFCLYRKAKEFPIAEFLVVNNIRGAFLFNVTSDVRDELDWSSLLA